MAFNLTDYATVEERLALFWAAHPDGRIVTELLVDDGTRIVMRCAVYRHRDDTVPTSVGHAEEIRTKSGINALSALEVCETSCAGRALANWRFQAKKRPSRLEMEKPARASQPQPPQDISQENETLNALCARIRARAKEKNYDVAAMRQLIVDTCGDGLKLADLTREQLHRLLEVMA